MRTVHVYKAGDELYASAAESVPALLGKKPFKIVVHDAVGCITCALGQAVERTVSSLRYRLTRNIQASLLAGALLVLLGWPLVYNAIPMPEVVLAARVVSGVLTGMGLLAVIAMCVQIYQLTHRIDFTLASIVYKKDGLLPRATAWRQTRRRAVFPWLGLGLILFSVALNCVVVADYAHPAVLNDGTVRRSMSLTSPWTRWYSRPEYLTGEICIAYSPQDYLPLHVTCVKYRVRNLDLSQPLPDIRDYELMLANGIAWYASRCQAHARTASEPGIPEAQMVKNVSEVIMDKGNIAGITKKVRTEFTQSFPGLRLETFTVSLRVMDMSEYGEIMRAQRTRWGL